MPSITDEPSNVAVESTDDYSDYYFHTNMNNAKGFGKEEYYRIVFINDFGKIQPLTDDVFNTPDEAREFIKTMKGLNEVSYEDIINQSLRSGEKEKAAYKEHEARLHQLEEDMNLLGYSLRQSYGRRTFWYSSNADNKEKDLEFENLEQLSDYARDALDDIKSKIGLKEVSKMEMTGQNMGQDIKENDVLNQFVKLLNQQNMGEQSQNYMELFQYVLGMQIQLGMVVNELQGIREQLTQLQEQQPKAATERLMNKAVHIQEKITNLSERLTTEKNSLVDTAAQAVSAFKEKGKSEMCKVLQKGISGVKPLLESCRKQLVEAMLDCEKAARRIDSIGNELKQVGNSVSNVGRLLSGKDTKDISNERPGVGLTRAINKSIKGVIASLQKNIKSIDKAYENLNRLSKGLDAHIQEAVRDEGASKESVLKKLGEYKKEAESKPKTEAKTIERGLDNAEYNR